MCDHRGPLIPSFRHPEALAPLGASHRKSAIADLRTRDPTSGKPEVGGRRPRPFILRGPRVRARPPQDDGIWIELTETRSSSWTHSRRLDLHAARAPHQVKLEIDVFRCTQSIGLCPHANETVAQAPLQRSQRLPFQSIERIAVGVALRDGRARELSSPIVIVALGTGQVELTL